jgi:hypothetical protein
MSLNRTAFGLGSACCLILALPRTLAVAASPFDVRGPDFAYPAQIPDSVSNTCADYNARVSTAGVAAPGGGSHPGTCGFSTFQILMDGQPAAQYLALLASGANPPPFRTVFKQLATGFCAVTSGVRVELGAIVQPNVSIWPKAGAIGGACAAESSRHPGIDYGALDARAGGTLRTMGHFFDVAVSGPNTVQVCLNQKQTPQAESLAAQKLAVAFAAKVKLVLYSHPILAVVAQWNQGAGITTSCLLRCNQCGSGWAGTITNTQVIEDAPVMQQYLANEVDTYFVGGTAIVAVNKIQIPADWTSTGSGFYTPTGNPSANRTWILNAAAAGVCPSNDTLHVCVEILTDMTSKALSFTETNEPLSIDNGYTLHMGGTVLMSPAGENPFKSAITISAAATDTSASGHQVVQPPAVATCGGHPPQLPGITLTCTQTWDWQLYLQQ